MNKSNNEMTDKQMSLMDNFRQNFNLYIKDMTLSELAEKADMMLEYK